MKDQRQHPRYRLRWPARLILGEDSGSGTVIEGRVHDLSIGGASVLCDLHIRNVRQLTVMLTPPALFPGQEQKIITVHSKLVYSVHSDGHLCFRAGLQFVRFDAAGRSLLEERLAYHAPVFERVPG
jgi:hypothetical protein